MRWLDILRVASRALLKNKMRAGLTMLGVMIGIAAVTAMVSLGQSASALVQGQFESLGTNVLMVFPRSARSGGVRTGNVTTLTPDDADAIKAQCAAVQAVSPQVRSGGQIVFGSTNWSPSEMSGVGPDYLRVRNAALKDGNFFTERDVIGATKVCVIGETVARELFQTANPLGAQIRIKNIPFKVIGVLQPKGANLVGQDQDNILLMPYTTVMKRLQGTTFNNIHMVLVSARSEAEIDDAQTQIRNLLRDRHRIRAGEEDDFEIRNTTEIANVFGIITTTLTLMLASIAAISLVVGGVGIMNIMLVSVTERTREIGIRMAVGARPRDILWQFLVESVVLSSFGGMVGVALGVSASIGLTMGINLLSPGAQWPVVISLPAAIVALLFSALVGIFFGFYPARRASRLDPIEALRYE